MFEISGIFAYFCKKYLHIYFFKNKYNEGWRQKLQFVVLFHYVRNFLRIA